KSVGAISMMVIGLAAIPLSSRFSVRHALLLVCLLGIVVALMSSPIGRLAFEKVAMISPELFMAKAETLQFGNQGSSFAWRLSYWLAMINAQLDSGWIALFFGHGGDATAE